MKKYVVYYLMVENVSNSDMYFEYRVVLKEIEGESTFDRIEDAEKRVMEFMEKKGSLPLTILPVYHNNW